MTNAEQSEVSPDADSSTFGLPGGASDTKSSAVLCETRRNMPILDANPSDHPEGGKPPEMEGRGVYRLVLAILVLTLALLTESRRLVESASLLLP